MSRLGYGMAHPQYPLAPYGVGKYYLPDGHSNPATGAAAAAGTVRMIPGYIRRSVTISALAVQVASAAASGNFQLAIYACDPVTGNPTGAPLVATTSQSTASVTTVEATISNTTIPAGLYWFAVCVDTSGATAVFRVPTLSVAQMGGASTATNSMLNVVSSAYLKTGTTFGTWPTLTGNVTTDSITYSTTAVGAAVSFKVA